MEITHYYPFGMTWTGTWQNQNNMPLENKYGYNGKEEISGIGLLDYGARFYDPAIASFTTIDPLTESFPHQSGYVYADNDPIGKIDFMGLNGQGKNDEFIRYQDTDGNWQQEKIGDTGGSEFDIINYGELNSDGEFVANEAVYTAEHNSSSSTSAGISFMGVNISFDGEVSSKVDLGIVYKKDSGIQGVTFKGPSIKAFEFKLKSDGSLDEYYFGKDGDYKGTILGGQIETGVVDAKASWDWRINGENSGTPLSGGVGRPYFEMKYKPNELKIGLQEDWGNSIGWYKVIGGAAKFGVNGQLKVTW